MAIYKNQLTGFAKETLKPFTYRIRIAIPEKTSKTNIYPYKRILIAFADKLVRQLKKESRHYVKGNNIDGYDDIYGKFLESSIRVNVKKDIIKLDEKIIWVEM